MLKKFSTKEFNQRFTLKDNSTDVVHLKFSVLENLATRCPDCYTKFLKFAKEKGIKVKLTAEEQVQPTIEEQVNKIRERMTIVKEKLQTQASLKREARIDLSTWEEVDTLYGILENWYSFNPDPKLREFLKHIKYYRDVSDPSLSPHQKTKFIDPNASLQKVAYSRWDQWVSSPSYKKADPYDDPMAFGRFAFETGYGYGIMDGVQGKTRKASLSGIGIHVDTTRVSDVLQKAKIPFHQDGKWILISSNNLNKVLKVLEDARIDILNTPNAGEEWDKMIYENGVIKYASLKKEAGVEKNNVGAFLLTLHTELLTMIAETGSREGFTAIHTKLVEAMQEVAKKRVTLGKEADLPDPMIPTKEHSTEEPTTEDLMRWIELDLDLVEHTYKDKPEVVKHIEEIENDVEKLEQMLGLKDVEPMHELSEPEHKEEIVEEASVDTTANRPKPTQPAPRGMAWTYEQKSDSWFLTTVEGM